ncbi:hypothetical protein GJU40_18175 [Bacillus lacus]|uniref:Uncharacterized protein n=1 Tax=Metabacillus lacus TaxID=1983721 RepID=A0A7X2J3F0_9BACI|nr:hypothetical protein [Metabacillus lacus]MRX74053.1 hypothetical protein [Metabacillus lacus]
MRVDIDIHEKHLETSITIHTKEWSEDLEGVLKKLKQTSVHFIFIRHKTPSSSA